VKSEHAMGYIKGRFCSLRGLRQQIDNDIDHKRALLWIKACIVIHTLIAIIESGSEDEGYVNELVQEGLAATVPTDTDDNTPDPAPGRETRGQRKRNALKAQLFESGVESRE
jgi:hypothetical protein